MPTLRLLSLLILAPVLLLACASAEQEKEPEYPPIRSLDDVTDITDKVLAWDVPVGTIEEFSIFDTIPPLPNPDPICFAPEGLDSFADGRKIPRQFGIEPDASPVERGFDPSIHARGRNAAEATENMVRQLRAVGALPESVDKNPKPFTSLRFGSGTMASAYGKALAAAPISGAEFKDVCVREGHHRVFTKKEARYGTWTVGTSYDVRVSEAGIATVKRITSFDGCELLCTAEHNETQMPEGYAVLLRNRNTLVTWLPDDSVIEVPFNFEPKYGLSIWNTPNNLTYGEGIFHAMSTDFPAFMLIERNFGVPRDAVLPEVKFTRTGFKTKEYQDFKKNNYVHSSTPESRTVLLSILDGKVLLDEIGVHRLWLLNGSEWVLPRVVHKGVWAYAVFKNGEIPNVIPSVSLIHKDPFYCRYDYRWDTMQYSYTGASALHYRTKKVTRVTYNHRVSKSIARAFFASYIQVSEPFMYGDVPARMVWELDPLITHVRFAVVIRDVLCANDLSWLFARGGDRVFLFNGESYFSFDAHVQRSHP